MMMKKNEQIGKQGQKRKRKMSRDRLRRKTRMNDQRQGKNDKEEE